jgi:transcriptional regulator with XRE-family HTH domain
MSAQPHFAAEIEQTVSALGAKVAKARAERGWSLQQLAARSGLSPAAIHKIEKSGMTPTITSLMKVATALGRSVGYFIEEADPLRPVTVVRRDERAQLYTSKRGLELQNVSGRYGPFFAAGAEAFVDPEDYHREEGDSIHFRTAHPHSWRNPTDRPARAIWLAIRSA